VSDKDAKRPAVAETVVGLPEVSGGATQVGLDPVAEPTTNPGFAGPEPTTDPSVAPAVTAPSLPPVAPAAPPAADGPTTIGAAPARRPSRLAVPAQVEGEPPPRRHSKGEVPVAEATTGPLPQLSGARRASRVAVPAQAPVDAAPTAGELDAAPAAPRRASRVAVPAQATPTDGDLDAAPTNPRQPRVDAPPPRFEPTPGLVAGVAGAIAALGMAAWLFWPAEPPPRPPPPPTPLALPEAAPPRPKPVEPEPAVAAAPPPAPAVPDRPVLSLDARTHVIDPFGLHAPDLPLDTGHKYRLRLERDDAKLGTVLARLDEAQGWGVVRKMASHAALQFGGAKALRLHCEPGRAFTDADTFPLELVDLATKKPIEFQVFPAKHCWDVEVMRTLDLGEGVRHRVRVPTDARLALGEKAPLRVAWVLESADEPRRWRTGILQPGESVIAEGRRARFALLDAYAGDNDGRLDLELLSPDTESTGLVTPASASGAKFVPVTPEAPK
jgi:hypothetical protein